VPALRPGPKPALYMRSARRPREVVRPEAVPSGMRHEVVARMFVMNRERFEVREIQYG